MVSNKPFPKAGFDRVAFFDLIFEIAAPMTDLPDTVRAVKAKKHTSAMARMTNVPALPDTANSAPTRSPPSQPAGEQVFTPPSAAVKHAEK